MEEFEKKYIALAKLLVPQAHKCIVDIDVDFPYWDYDGTGTMRPVYEVFVDSNCKSPDGMGSIAIRGDVLGYVWSFHNEYFPNVNFDTEYSGVTINFV